MKKLFLASILISLLAIGTAWSTTFTLTQSDLLAFDNTWINGGTYPAPGDPTIAASGAGVQYKASIANDTTVYGDWAAGGFGYNFATISGLSFGGNLSAYSDFALSFYNNNDDKWAVNIFINTGWTDAPWNETNQWAENTWTWFSPGETKTVTMSLAGVNNLNHVTNIGFQIGSDFIGNPSHPNYDIDYPSDTDHYDVIVSPIPEPSTIILLGFGFLGLAAYGWRRKKKSEAS
jgi:hypothetical protein